MDDRLTWYKLLSVAGRAELFQVLGDTRPIKGKDNSVGTRVTRGKWLKGFVKCCARVGRSFWTRGVRAVVFARYRCWQSSGLCSELSELGVGRASVLAVDRALSSLLPESVFVVGRVSVAELVRVFAGFSFP